MSSRDDQVSLEIGSIQVSSSAWRWVDVVYAPIQERTNPSVLYIV